MDDIFGQICQRSLINTRLLIRRHRSAAWVIQFASGCQDLAALMDLTLKQLLYPKILMGD